jgi:hypothetical protein
MRTSTDSTTTVALGRLLTRFRRRWRARQVGSVRADPVVNQMAYLKIDVDRGNSVDRGGVLQQPGESRRQQPIGNVGHPGAVRLC